MVRERGRELEVEVKGERGKYYRWRVSQEVLRVGDVVRVGEMGGRKVVEGDYDRRGKYVWKEGEIEKMKGEEK